MKWGELKALASELGIPDNAKVLVHALDDCRGLLGDVVKGDYTSPEDLDEETTMSWFVLDVKADK